MKTLVDRIDAILPQTQCRKCTYTACRPYAEAIASAEADINQCPPGGQKGIDAIATLLDVKSIPLNPEYGEEKPARVAFIIEEECIGCLKCIQACPIDAIVGAAKQMHTIIAAECTGCELCIEPCPVDCITLQPTTSNDHQYQPEKAKMRYEAKVKRQDQDIKQKAERDKRRKATLAKLIATKNKK